MDFDLIIKKYKLSLNNNHKQYILSNKYTLIINGTKYYLIKSKISLKCKNISYLGEDLYQKPIIIQLTNHNLEYEDNLGTIYIDASTLGSCNSACCKDDCKTRWPDCSKCCENFITAYIQCNHCASTLNCKPFPAPPPIQQICDSSNDMWVEGMPLNYIGLCDKLENKIISSLDTLIAGITYNGIERTTADCTINNDRGCCNYNGQNSVCMAACPYLSVGSNQNTFTFPPVAEVYEKASYISSDNLDDDDIKSCLENGNYWIENKCVTRTTTAYSINKSIKIDSRLCSNIMTYLAEPVMPKGAQGSRSIPVSGTTLSQGIFPYINSPGTAIGTLALWLGHGLNISTELYQNESTNIKNYIDIAYYLTKTLPMGRHSEVVPQGGYNGGFYDDFEWWGMSKVQALYSLMNRTKSETSIVDILEYEFIGVVRSCMYIWNTVDSVCKSGTLWQGSSWALTNIGWRKSAITNLLLIYNSTALYKFYYKYNNTEPFKTVISNINKSNGIIINSYTTMSIDEVIHELETIIITQFSWIISPLNDTSKVQGQVDNTPTIGMNGRVYDQITWPSEQSDDCIPPGTVNLAEQYSKLWASSGEWQTYNNWSFDFTRPICKGTIPAQNNKSIGTSENVKCFTSWANSDYVDDWPINSESWTTATTCSSDQGCNATTYNQGLFIAICCLLADSFTNDVEPLSNSQFDLSFYNYDRLAEAWGQATPILINLKKLTKATAYNAMINLALNTSEFTYNNLSLKTVESKIIISDSDLNNACNISPNSSPGDVKIFKAILAYGITTLIGTLKNMKPQGYSNKFLTKYIDYINNTAEYIWNNTRNPLSNMFSYCYPNSVFNDQTTPIGEYSSDEILFSNLYSPEGQASSTVIIQCQHIISSNNYSLLGVN